MRILPYYDYDIGIGLCQIKQDLHLIVLNISSRRTFFKVWEINY